MGHTIDENGVNINAKKVSAVWPVPTCVTEVQKFLGFTNFFRRFIRDYACITAPLTNLCKSTVPWNWSVSVQDAFQ